MENLVRVGVADAVDDPRIGERPLECVVRAREPCSECREVDVQRIESARIQRTECRSSVEDVE
jgi:hypothetical protein